MAAALYWSRPRRMSIIPRFLPQLSPQKSTLFCAWWYVVVVWKQTGQNHFFNENFFLRSWNHHGWEEWGEICWKRPHENHFRSLSSSMAGQLVKSFRKCHVIRAFCRAYKKHIHFIQSLRTALMIQLYENLVVTRKEEKNPLWWKFLNYIARIWLTFNSKMSPCNI